MFSTELKPVWYITNNNQQLTNNISHTLSIQLGCNDETIRVIFLYLQRSFLLKDRDCGKKLWK